MKWKWRISAVIGNFDNNPDPEPIGGAQALPPAYDSRQPREEPMYAQVDKSKKKMYKLQGTEGPQTDSWV